MSSPPVPINVETGVPVAPQSKKTDILVYLGLTILHPCRYLALQEYDISTVQTAVIVFCVRVLWMCEHLNPLTNWADSGRWSSNAGGGNAVLHGSGVQLVRSSSSSRHLWGSWGGVGWLALGCLRLGRQVQWLCTLTVLQKPKQHSFACCDHRRNLEAGGAGPTLALPSPRPLSMEVC